MDIELLHDLGFKKENHNVLSDLHVSITYSEALTILYDLRSVIYNTEIALHREKCVAFFFRNQVIDILLLVLLIVEKQSFILLNGNNKEIIESEFKQIQFCSYTLSTKNTKQNFKFSEIEKYFFFKQNENFKFLKSSVIEKGSILFKSSGSTGKNKIVIHNVKILIKNSLEFLKHLDVDSGTKIAIPVPIYHMYGFGAGLIPSLLKGISLILVNNTNILAYLDAERLFNPDVVFMTPGILEMYLKFKRNHYNYKYIISAGDQLNDNTVKKVNTKFGRLINLYGSTELGVIATSKNVKEGDNNLLLPLNNVKISSLPLCENLKELLCDHPNPFRGYFDIDDMKVVNTIDNSKVFNTHDLIIEYADKKFKLNGRKNLCLNRKGVLVSIPEIEEKTKFHIREINEIVIFQTKEIDIYKGNIICACIEFNKGQKLSNDDLIVRCKTFLEDYKIPDSFIEVYSMPYLSSGKLDRKKVELTFTF